MAWCAPSWEVWCLLLKGNQTLDDQWQVEGWESLEKGSFYKNLGLGFSGYLARCWSSVFQNYLLISLTGWWNLWHPYQEVDRNGHLGMHEYLFSESRFDMGGVLILWSWTKTWWKHLQAKAKGHTQKGSGCWGQVLPTGIFFLGGGGARLSDTVQKTLSHWSHEKVCRSVVSVPCREAALPLNTGQSPRVCVLPLAGFVNHPCQLRVEMSAPHSWLLPMLPLGWRYSIDISVITLCPIPPSLLSSLGLYKMAYVCFLILALLV